jgi:hypothetical protein
MPQRSGHHIAHISPPPEGARPQHEAASARPKPVGAKCSALRALLGDEIALELEVRRRDKAAQVEFETKVCKLSIILQFQALSSRLFQLGFDRVNLHRPTVTLILLAMLGRNAAPSRMQWRKLYLKAKLESTSSYLSFKRVVSGAFKLGLIGSTCTGLPGLCTPAARSLPSGTSLNRHPLSTAKQAHHSPRHRMPINSRNKGL